jgi:methionyl-tRNA formyltransferase
MNDVTYNKFVFVGNRRFVLESMLAENIRPVLTLVAANTHLEKDIVSLGIPFQIFKSKKELLDLLQKQEYEILISNGCPFILPVLEMKPAQYVNIHPSFLPDLKGIDPAIGAILFKRDAGATCHVMDTTIDGGDIISQIKIPYSPDLEVSLCYQLSFKAEKEVFIDALRRSFAPARTQVPTGDEIYYSRCIDDRRIHDRLSVDDIIQRCKAFNNKSQGALLSINGKTYHLHAAKEIHNSYAISSTKDQESGCVLFQYEANIIFRHRGKLIKVTSFTDDLSGVKVGTKLF